MDKETDFKAIDWDIELEKTAERIPFFIYSRVSTDEQFLERQRAGIKKYLPNLPRSYEMVGAYEDKSTGKNFKRPDFKKMMNMIKARKAKVVIVYSMDRFSRSIKDFHIQWDLFKKYDCHLHLIKENITITHEDNPFQNVIVNMLLSIAQFYRELQVQTTTEGMATTRAANPYKLAYGETSKITLVKDGMEKFISMYYSKQPRSEKSGRAGRFDARRSDTFRYTLQDIGDVFDLTKNSVSEIVSKHIRLGTMVHRSPKMIRVPEATGSMADLMPKKPRAFPKKKLQALMAYEYWPQEVKDKMVEEFGVNYKYSNKKETFIFGKKTYKLWIRETMLKAMTIGDLERLEPAEMEKLIETLTHEQREAIMEADAALFDKEMQELISHDMLMEELSYLDEAGKDELIKRMEAFKD